MPDDQIQKLTELFAKFPGVGPRQARRFVYYLIHKESGYLGMLTETIKNIHHSVLQCSDCKRFYALRREDEKGGVCFLCRDENKNSSTLLIVEKDADLENIERTGAYTGHYFVLGGLIPVLEKEPEKRIRLKYLKSLLERKKEISEIIIALTANVDGDHTAEYIKNALSVILKEKGTRITTLGRGLSTGTELEYSDSDTLKNALKNRG